MPQEIKQEFLKLGIDLRRRILEIVDRYKVAALGPAPSEFEAVASEYREMSVKVGGLPE